MHEPVGMDVLCVVCLSACAAQGILCVGFNKAWQRACSRVPLGHAAAFMFLDQASGHRA